MLFCRSPFKGIGVIRIIFALNFHIVEGLIYVHLVLGILTCSEKALLSFQFSSLAQTRELITKFVNSRFGSISGRKSYFLNTTLLLTLICWIFGIIIAKPRCTDYRGRCTLCVAHTRVGVFKHSTVSAILALYNRRGHAWTRLHLIDSQLSNLTACMQIFSLIIVHVVTRNAGCPIEFARGLIFQS